MKFLKTSRLVLSSIQCVMEAVSAGVIQSFAKDNCSPLYSVKVKNKLLYSYTTSQCSEEKL